MAILTGFPPSNTVGRCINIPQIRETKVKITELKPEHRFTHMEAEFMVLKNTPQEFRAVCYKGSEKGAAIAGHIYCFDTKIEVLWFEEYYL